MDRQASGQHTPPGVRIDHGPDAMVAADLGAGRFYYRWIIFAALALDGVLLYFHYTWGATLSGYHAETWALDAERLGLLAALGFFPYALMQIPGGYLTDLLGVRKVMTIAITLTALGTAIFAAAPAYALAVVGRTLIGIGSAVILLPALKLLSRWFRKDEFGTIQGAFLLLSAAGSVAATVPLALAAERWGWRAPMLAVAVLTAIAAAVSWGLLRNDPRDLDLPGIEAVDQQATPTRNAPDTPRPSLRVGLRAWATITTLWGSSVIIFASWGSIQAFQGLWAGPLLRHVRGFSPPQVGETLFMFTLGLAIGPVLFGFASDRLGVRKPIVVFATVGQMVFWTVVILTVDRLPLVLLNVAILGIALLGGGVLVVQVMIAELCPPGMFGIVFGIINGSAFYGSAALQLLSGMLLTAIGPVTVAAEPVYSAQSYTLALSPIIGLMLIAAVISLRLGETLGPGRVRWPSQIW